MTEAVKTYRLALYTVQFVVSPEFVDHFSNGLPRLLTKLHINDETTRISIIQTLRNFVDDYKAIMESRSPASQLMTKTSRSFIKRFLAVFGILVLTIPIRKRRFSIARSDLVSPSQYATAAATLTSAMPLIRKIVPQSIKSSLILSSASLAMMPEGYPKDYLSVYALFQGLESLAQILQDNLSCKLQYWTLMPICLSQLLQQLSTSPDHLPGLVSRLFTGLYSGLIEQKPVWYNAEWPKTIDTFVTIKKVKRVNRGLLRTEVILTRTNPVHTNAKFSVMSPSEPSLSKVLMSQAPKKWLMVFLLSAPLFFATYRFRSKMSDTKTGSSNDILSTSACTSCQDDDDDDDGSTDDIITKGENKVDAVQFEYSPLPDFEPSNKNSSDLQKAIKSASKFSTVTIGSLVTSYVLFTTRLHPRLNGLISGLWWYAYRDTAASPLFAYLARITLLSIFRQKRDKNMKSKNSVLKNLCGVWGSTIVGTIAVTLLMKLNDEGKNISGRFGKYAQFIKTGGKIV